MWLFSKDVERISYLQIVSPISRYSAVHFISFTSAWLIHNRCLYILTIFVVLYVGLQHNLHIISTISHLVFKLSTKMGNMLIGRAQSEIFSLLHLSNKQPPKSPKTIKHWTNSSHCHSQHQTHHSRDWGVMVVTSLVDKCRFKAYRWILGWSLNAC